MKEFNREYRIPHFHGEEFDRYFGGLKPCVFDIETTGFSKTSNKVILTAMLVPFDGGVRVTQFLAENHFEENRVIKATLDYMKKDTVDYLLTFNGISFDIPFFNARAEYVHSEDVLRFYNFDLYTFLKKHSTLPQRLDSLSQKSVEKCFGIYNARRDTISGGESVRLFNEYAVSGSSLNEKLILTHNREDVTQLHTLMLRAGFEDFSNILKADSLDESLSTYGFPVRSSADSAADLAVRARIDIRKSLIIITGDQFGDAVSAELYPDDCRSYRASFSAATRSLRIELPYSTYGDDFYINIKALGLDNELRELDSYVNGHLILRSDGRTDSRAVNALAAAMAASLYNSYK